MWILFLYGRAPDVVSRECSRCKLVGKSFMGLLDELPLVAIETGLFVPTLSEVFSRLVVRD